MISIQTGGINPFITPERTGVDNDMDPNMQAAVLLSLTDPKNQSKFTNN